MAPHSISLFINTINRLAAFSSFRRLMFVSKSIFALFFFVDRCVHKLVHIRQRNMCVIFFYFEWVTVFLCIGVWFAGLINLGCCFFFFSISFSRFVIVSCMTFNLTDFQFRIYVMNPSGQTIDLRCDLWLFVTQLSFHLEMSVGLRLKS